MEKLQANVVFLSKNIRTCLFTHIFLYFLHLVITPPPPPLHHNGKGSIKDECVFASATCLPVSVWVHVKGRIKDDYVLHLLPVCLPVYLSGYM